MASARSALGVPSRLPLSAFWIAKRLILQPHCSAAWAKAAEREAGYTVLGAICGAVHADVVYDKQWEMLDLFKLALGATAKEALDPKKWVGEHKYILGLMAWQFALKAEYAWGAFVPGVTQPASSVASMCSVVLHSSKLHQGVVIANAAAAYPSSSVLLNALRLPDHNTSSCVTRC